MTVATRLPLDHRLLDELRRAVGGAPSEMLAAVETALRDRWDALESLVAGAAGRQPASRIVHAETAFSVVVLTLPPGTSTAVHDHLTWCTVAVVRGDEHETTYLDRGTHLEVCGEATNPVGSVTSLVPPGDIHRVRNDSSGTAASVHVYGADLSRAGSSVRRVYETHH